MAMNGGTIFYVKNNKFFEKDCFLEILTHKRKL